VVKVLLSNFINTAMIDKGEEGSPFGEYSFALVYFFILKIYENMA
jgi:hypothetical protein